MLPRIIATLSLASLCLLSYMVTFTSPADAGPFGLLTIFITAYLTFVGMISFFLYGVDRLAIMVLAKGTVKKVVRDFTFKKAYYYASVLALAPVLLVGLQSVGAISVYQVGLVILFEIIACIYVGKRM